RAGQGLADRRKCRRGRRSGGGCRGGSPGFGQTPLIPHSCSRAALIASLTPKRKWVQDFGLDADSRRCFVFHRQQVRKLQPPKDELAQVGPVVGPAVGHTIRIWLLVVPKQLEAEQPRDGILEPENGVWISVRAELPFREIERACLLLHDPDAVGVQEVPG